MNAIPMLQHCGYHQRKHNASCTVCGSLVVSPFEGLKSVCEWCHGWVETVPVGPCPQCG